MFFHPTDDPYFYLYYGKLFNGCPSLTHGKIGDRPRYPSYFALELEEPDLGRVLRFDSFSKVLSAGIRIGFASGPAPLLDAIDLHVSLDNYIPNLK